jgi:hypothetical protein
MGVRLLSRVELMLWVRGVTLLGFLDADGAFLTRV